VLVSGEGDLYAHRQLIAELDEKNRLPAKCPYRDYVEAGGLMAYTVDLAELLRRMANRPATPRLETSPALRRSQALRARSFSRGVLALGPALGSRDQRHCCVDDRNIRCAGRQSQLSHGEALRQSMLAMINHPQQPNLVEPKYWAPFVVVGEPAKPMP
jgi:hypothetical protein